MKLYIIMSHTTHKPVRYGLIGDNQTVGFCLYRGQIAAFTSRIDAQMNVNNFDNPDDYEIVEFTH